MTPSFSCREKPTELLSRMKVSQTGPEPGSHDTDRSQNPSVPAAEMVRGPHLHDYLFHRTGTSIKHPAPLNEVLIVRTEQCPET